MFISDAYAKRMPLCYLDYSNLSAITVQLAAETQVQPCAVAVVCKCRVTYELLFRYS